ncbi:hypothetical protein CQ018_02930 [Arthrobacter sp. MYb227]|uniref:hypothetical protein n=1 Tax=Arthrobacter sp. MYb227 TaxID=1848601 RepID=UPI000CFC4A7F|nr:hypothetical protein [Arthrobacter sp. MYb227]PQZ96245.1 hypothetical protein CQ018_02930 [Arthrobacter sp. MYb227]
MEKKRGRIVAFTIGAVLVFGVAVIGAVWVSNAAKARSQVEVLIGADAFSCERPEDVTIFEYELGSSEEIKYPVPALKLNDGLACTFSFSISNAGKTKVSLTGLGIAMMGEGNANGAHMPRLTLNLIERTVGGSADANFVLNQDLLPGDAVRISAVVERSPGCMSVGGSMGTVRTPEVTLSAYGLSGTVTPQGPAFAVVGTPDSTCDT